MRDHRAWTGELRARTSSGTLLDLLVSATVVVDERGRAVCLLGAFEDITDRRRAEASLHASLGEKDALLEEVHHRVKNNLQIVSSLLRLEVSRRESSEVKGVLAEMQGRITDVVMPGMSGPDLAEKLTAARPGLKVLFVSGYTDDKLAPVLSMKGAHFLPKPFTVTLLTRKVRQILDSAAGQV